MMNEMRALERRSRRTHAPPAATRHQRTVNNAAPAQATLRIGRKAACRDADHRTEEDS